MDLILRRSESSNLSTSQRAPRAVRRNACESLGALAVAVSLSMCCHKLSIAATVFWNTDTSGSWHTSSNWSGGVLPGSLADVVINRGAASPTVTYSTGSATVNSLSTSEALRLTGGELKLSAASTISGPFTFTTSAGPSARLVVADALTISGDATWSLTATLAGTGVTTFSGNSSVSFGGIEAGHRVVNRGTMTFSNSIGFGSGAIFENHAVGTLILTDGFENGLSGDILIEPKVNNIGTLRKDSGTGQASLSNMHNSGLVLVQQGMLALGSGTSSGRFEVTPGATLSLSGKQSLTSASVVDAPNADIWINFPTIGGSGGQIAGAFSAARLTVYNGSFDTPNITFVGPAPAIGSLVLKQAGHVDISSDGPVTLGSLDLGTYPETPGVLSGTATINVTGLITGDGGWIRGPGTTNALGGIAAQFGVLNGRTLNNSGIATGRVGLGFGAVVNNLPGATWTMNNGFDSDLSSRFNNMGLVRWNVPSPLPSDPPLSRFGGSLNNTGTIEVHAGRAIWGAGESVNAGTIKLFDGVKLEISSGQLKQVASGSLLGGNADLGVGQSNATTLLLDGQVSLRDLTFRYGEMSFLGSMSKRVRTLTTEFHSEGVVKIGGSGTTINHLVASGGEVQILGGANVVELMEINGRGIVSIMTGTTYSPSTAFVLENSGTLWIHNGSGFSLPGSAPFSQTAGLVIVDGKLFAASAAFTGFSGLGGHGLVDSSLLLGGTIDPGASPIFGDMRPGKLTIAGNFDAESSARFVVQIIGHSSSGEFNSLAVGGHAQIDGSLHIRLANGFVPTVGERFVVLTAASRSGTFATIFGEQISDDLKFVPTWEGNSLVLVAVPEPSTYLLMIVGMGFVVFVARRRKHP